MHGFQSEYVAENMCSNGIPTLFHHFLHGACGINFLGGRKISISQMRHTKVEYYHGVEVVVALDQLRVFGKLLSERIYLRPSQSHVRKTPKQLTREVVRGVRGD
jgi:hypothetical protein